MTKEVCGRCLTPITPNSAEYCWFCGSVLCCVCWDRFGHCGHKEADEINEISRKADYGGRRQIMGEFNRGRRKEAAIRGKEKKCLKTGL